MKIELWPVDRLKPYPRNARKISDKAVAKVAQSIQAFGFRQPVVVDAEDVIVIGHVRRLAAIKLKLAEVPVHVADNLSAAEIKALRLMDNRSHEETGWDLQMLGAELLDIRGMDFGLELTGFDPRDLDPLLTSQTDEEKANICPDVPIAPVARPGDLWLLGGHRLVCGDSTDKNGVWRACGADAGLPEPLLMVTDPPYGIELDTEWRDRAGLNGCRLGPASYPAEPSYMKHRTEGHTETSISGDTIADWSHAFELVPSIQVAYVWHASVYTREVLNGLERIGFLYPQQIIWDKGRMALTRTHYWYQHEPCWYVRKKNAPWFGKAGENSTIWEAASPKMIMGGSNEQKYDHPTQKPVELMVKPIRNHTEPGAAVYEPFMGSGTTLMACEMTGRVCYGSEIDPKYVDVIIQRWQGYTGKEAVLGDGDYKGCTFAQTKEGRRQKAEDDLMEEALVATEAPATKKRSRRTSTDEARG